VLLPASRHTVVVDPQLVREPLRHRGLLALFPQRHHHQLLLPRPANVHQAWPLEVAYKQRPALAGLSATRRTGASDARGDFLFGLQRAPHALSEALGGVVGDGYEQVQRTAARRP